MTREFLDRQTEKWALVRRIDAANDRLAIFVHGFRGGYLETWGALADALHARADSDPRTESYDYLFLGYPTNTIGNLLAIAELIATQWSFAAQGEPPFDRPYRHLALFGHSLGTLGIRQLLCATCDHDEGFVDALKAVTFFGSPLNGSDLALFGKAGAIADIKQGLLQSIIGLMPGGYAIRDALQPDGPQIRMLQRWNRSIRHFVKLPPVQLYQGADDLVVGGLGLYDPWDGDRRHAVALDHRELSKLSDASAWTSSGFVNALKRGLP